MYRALLACLAILAQMIAVGFSVSCYKGGEFSGKSSAQVEHFSSTPSGLVSEGSLFDTFHKEMYPYGRFYLFLSHINNNAWRASQLNVELLVFMRWLVAWGFEPILLPAPTESRLRVAVNDPKLSAMIWFTHGTPSGCMRDYQYQNFLSPNAFIPEQTMPNWRFFLAVSCYGKASIERHSLKNNPKLPNLQPFGWAGEIWADRKLINYLLKNEFADFLGKAFGTTFQK